MKGTAEWLCQCLNPNHKQEYLRVVVLSSWTKIYKSITDPILTMVICDYVLLCTVDYKQMLVYNEL
jgi:hypothetical protein